ncbi:hypothetical protein BLS_007888 [Venturia inaequalis]|uniref:BZIP domain-containing protein n=1 Tax=Venturia inaequalis TaxID=5025 RepID=A0A8H3UAC1_VENIN|nr:hypothetical protein BLS_007888 [Venturia inaequalis]
MSSLASFGSGNYGFGNDSPVLGGLGMARGSHAQWSSVGSETNSTKSPLERLGFKLNLTGEKRTRDGQPPKRRGPKPDSKPALTRRQELNRQAQRTHRERKEHYMKALEEEVLNLKENYALAAREKEAADKENRRLKELLAAHGIQYDNSSPSNTWSSSPHFSGSSPGLNSRGSVTTEMTSPARSAPILTPQSSMQGTPTYDNHSAQQYQQQHNPSGVNYDQVGIDFVLTLERPCMDHMQFLMVRSEDSDGEISGHALMATCPPASHIKATPEEKYPHQMPDMPAGSLMALLDMSDQVVNPYIKHEEVTPIKAWTLIRSDERSHELTNADFETIRTALLGKVRCYGFGAVLEDFEVRDALEDVYAQKSVTSDMGQAQIGYAQEYPADEDSKMQG